MSTRILSHYEIVSQMPPDTVVTFHGVSWEEYEELLDQIGESAGLRVSFNDGRLEVMTLSTEHESYARFIERLMTAVCLRLRINIRSFGSATMKERKRKKGNEPDACFYIQTASVIGNRIHLDFATDPPPDVAVEVDIHHDSQSKFPIYAALGVSEIWRFDGRRLSIHLLHDNNYVEVAQSRALPMLTSQVLTEFLTRLPIDGEFQTLMAFDEWLQSQVQDSK
jgi:Uma2 family endonuclease